MGNRMQEVELSEILEALQLGQDKALELMASTGVEVFGCSFDASGIIQWQFIVYKVMCDRVIVKTYSWIDGSFHSYQTICLNNLKAECLLFLSEEEWLSFCYDHASSEFVRARSVGQ